MSRRAHFPVRWLQAWHCCYRATGCLCRCWPPRPAKGAKRLPGQAGAGVGAQAPVRVSGAQADRGRSTVRVHRCEALPLLCPLLPWQRVHGLLAGGTAAAAIGLIVPRIPRVAHAWPIPLWPPPQSTALSTGELLVRTPSSCPVNRKPPQGAPHPGCPSAAVLSSTCICLPTSAPSLNDTPLLMVPALLAQPCTYSSSHAAGLRLLPSLTTVSPCCASFVRAFPSSSVSSSCSVSGPSCCAGSLCESPVSSSSASPASRRAAAAVSGVPGPAYTGAGAGPGV